MKTEGSEISRICASCILAFYLMLVVSPGSMAAQEPANIGRGRTGPPAPIKITIPAFPDGGAIPVKYANTPAGSISPAIEWSGIP